METNYLDKFKLSKETKSDHVDKTNTVSFTSLQVGNRFARYGLQYNYLRCLIFFEETETLGFISDGYQFTIEGKNITLLFDMIVNRSISKIIENTEIKSGQHTIKIESVIAETIKEI